MAPRSVRGAFTLIELLVVIAIISILVSIVLPAVQMARASAWNATCQSRLKGLATAVHQYHDTHRCIPLEKQLTNPSSLIDNSFFSVQSSLLPYLGESAIYDGMNHAAGLPAAHRAAAYLWAANYTASQSRVAAFLCPADGETRRWPGAVSFRGSWGVGPFLGRSAEFPDSGNGFFSRGGQATLRFASIYDGLAGVAMFSERLVGNGSLQLPSQRPILSVPGGTWNDFKSADAMARLCARVALVGESAGGYAMAGKYWLFAGQHLTYYNHVLPPNSAIPDCQDLDFEFPYGASGARSAHSGGVNVARGDGSVSFVSETVSITIWRALASRDGGEAIPDL